MADSGHTETIHTGAARTTPLFEEHLLVERRVVETGRVRIRLSAATEGAVVRETLRSERVEVAAAQATREEDGAVLVVPVVEKVLVTERRLVLEEEPQVRRVSTSSTSGQTVPLRRRTATAERLPARLGADPETNGRRDGAGDPT